MASGTPEGLEEERRLFDVAITRARRHLAIYVPLRFHHHRVRDDHSWTQPSRFLSDAVRSTLVELPAEDKINQVTSSSSEISIDGSQVVTGQLSKLW